MTYNTDKEVQFQSPLAEKLRKYIDTNNTPFDSVTLEKTVDMEDETHKKSADIFIESKTHKSLVIETKQKDKEFLLDKKNIVQAKNYAEGLGYSTFALANSEDLFLFDYQGDETEISEIDFYHLNLRKYQLKDIPSKLLSATFELHKNETLPEQIEKDKIIAILRTFQSHTYPTFKKLIKNKHGKDRKFKKDFTQWVEKNGYDDKKQTQQFDILAKQHTYALINRILFYKLLKDNNIGQDYDDVILDDINTYSATGIQKRAKTQFKKVSEHINYKPIFDIENEIFGQIPSNKRTDELFQNLLRNLKSINIHEINEDLIGQLYEELISKQERKELGQFYTPPSVAKTISKWTLNADSSPENHVPKVLDPACGSGTFPVEVYKELEQNYDDISHQQIIDKLSVVDINKFPLQLTGINLTSQNITESTAHINDYHGSFFDYPEPEEIKERDGELFDAIVGNPPYIASNDLHPNTEHFREHLKEYNPDGNKVPEYYRGTKKLSKRTDAYIYFITNALRYLKERGRLGVIIPSAWMDTSYGQDFRQFLFDNVRVKSVVTFSQRTFEDADVNTSMLFLEKCSNEEERNNTIVDFIKIRGSLNPEDTVDILDFEIDLKNEYDYTEMSEYTVYSTTQESLKKEYKWSHLVNTPKPILKILESDNISILEKEVDDIYTGVKTGNSSFFVVSQETIDTFNIEDKFLSIGTDNGGTFDTVLASESNVEDRIFNIKEFVKEHNLKNIKEVKSKLKENNHKGALRYIKYAESKEMNKYSTLQKQDIWCEINKITSPDIIHRQLMNKDYFQINNNDNIIVTNNYYCIDTENNSDHITAILNSHIYNNLIECYGQTGTQGSIKLQARTLRNMPFPNLDKLSKNQKQRLEKSLTNILNNEYQGIADEVVLEVLGLEDEISVDELEEIHNSLVTARIEGVEPDVLLNDGRDSDEAGALEEADWENYSK